MTFRSRRLQAAGPRVVVVGAGAFGGWTALELVRRGARVTLVDAWGPGNVRASSGGETRVIRATYGAREIYTRMAIRALDLWRAHDRRFQTGFFKKTSALWMFGKDTGFGRDSLAALRAAKQPIDELSRTEARRRYPQINFDDISSVLIEPEAGYLLARRACEHVAQQVVAEGGTYLERAVISPVRIEGNTHAVRLADGPPLSADVFVFACGPWLGSLFPDVIGSNVTPTRQEVFYFGTPAGDPRFTDQEFPVWVELGERLIYGIPGNANRGFKIGDDTSGPRFDPTNGEREISPAALKRIRRFLSRRFPALARAPLVGAEVCQYEASPDSHFIVDRHPGADNVWIAGGGSGHGFKMGPAIGEMIAGLVLGGTAVESSFSLQRFSRDRRVRRRSETEKWA